MTRNRQTRTRTAKPKYQWFGGFEGHPVVTRQSTATTDLIQLRPAHLSLDADRSVVVKRLILNMGIRRLTNGTVGALGGLAAIMSTDSVGTPTDVLEIFSGDPFVTANTDIIRQFVLAVPPVVGSGGSVIGKEILVSQIDFKVNRKIDLARTAVILQVNADISDVIQFTVWWRMLLQTS